MKRKHKTKQANKTKIRFLVFSWVVLSATQIFLWGTDWQTHMEWPANISNKKSSYKKKTKKTRTEQHTQRQKTKTNAPMQHIMQI